MLLSMAIADHKSSSSSSSSNGKVRGFFKRPFRPSDNATTTTTSSSSMSQSNGDGSIPHVSSSLSSVAKSLLPTCRTLKLDPCNKLYFPCSTRL